MKQNKLLKDTGLFLLFGGPSLFAFSAIILIPFLYGIGLTFTNWSLTNRDSSFIGLLNYQNVLKDSVFLSSFWFTLKYVFFCVLLANVMAFFLALALSSGRKGEKFLRTGFFTPNLIGGIVLGYLWQSLFSQLLPYLGKTNDWNLFKTSWLTDPDKAFWALVLVSSWQLVGYLMIIYIAGFANIPKDVLEAAAIDGASGLKKLTKIMLPFSIPTVVICLFISVSRSFLTYDVNLSLTKGGPFRSTEMISYHIVQKAFLQYEYGTGQAAAVVLYIVVAVIALSQTYLLKRMEVEA